MPQPLTPLRNIIEKKSEGEGRKLTIRNPKKIRGLCLYDDGSWEGLQATHQKPGGRAYIEWIEETEMWYRLRLLYILPQPDSAIITIWRDGETIVGTPMWKVEMEKGRQTVVSEFWEAEQFRMKRLLEAIKVWLID